MGRDSTIISKELVKKIILLILALCLFPIAKPMLTTQANCCNNSEIVIEETSGRVLSGNNIHAQLPMASTTKIVTALVVLDNLDINAYITISPKATNIEGSSIYLKPNHKWKVVDLLYGLMLRSGNDAAAALAIATAGSLEEFAQLMNNKAISLGLKNSNFTNPHGLHDDMHYTSAYDLAMLTREAMKYDLFKTIVNTKSYSYDSPEDYRGVFINKNKMLNAYTGANGVKTGYTKKAGRCLVSSAEREGMQLITVTINCNNMWMRSIELMDRAFSDYSMYNILDEREIVGETNISNSKRQTAVLVAHESFSYPLMDNEIASLKYVKNFNTLKAPVKTNECAGSIKVFIDNHLLFETNVYTIENIPLKGVRDRIRDLADRFK